jgi:hypothetical protein
MSLQIRRPGTRFFRYLAFSVSMRKDATEINIVGQGLNGVSGVLNYQHIRRGFNDGFLDTLVRYDRELRFSLHKEHRVVVVVRVTGDGITYFF